MRFYLISQPDYQVDEIQILQSCFDAGLECFHLRKPQWKKNDLEDWLRKLPAKFHPYVQIHGEVSTEFHVRGRHLPEYVWRSMSATALEKLKVHLHGLGQQLSLSLHDVAEVHAWETIADYAFISPVYASISKKNYAANPAIIAQMPSLKTSLPMIALGGVTTSRYKVLKSAGFSGVAVLGAFWNETTLQDRAEYWIRAKAMN